MKSKEKVLKGFIAKIKVIVPVLLLFILMCAWSGFKEYDRWGDEVMRYQIPKFIFDNNRLPTLFDTSIYDELYGFSYAGTPNLPYIIMALFMKIAAFFGVSESGLFWVARLTNITFGVIFAYLVMKIANEIFNNRYLKGIFIALVTLWPELLYIFIYVNTDAMALLGVAVITLYSIRGVNSKWNFKNCAGVILGDVVIILSYQNAYGFVLVSAFVFIASFFKDGIHKVKVKEMLVKGIAIMSSVGVCTLWFYIRNFILYGSLLGSNITKITSLKYGDPTMSSEIRIEHAKEMMSSLSGIVFWFKQSLTTFFAWGWYDAIKFNYPHIVYQVVNVIIVLIGITACIVIVKNWKIITYGKRVIIIGMTIGGAITFALSFYYSAFCDYVPFGRYWLPAIITFGMMMTYGISIIVKKIKFSEKATFIIISSLLILADISVVIFR